MPTEMIEDLFAPRRASKQALSRRRKEMNPSSKNEPIYDENYKDYLKEHWLPCGYKIWTNVKDWLGEEVDFRDLYLTLEDLPVIKSRDGRMKGKVLGVYQPDTRRIALDRTYDGDIESVLTHEGVHSVQDKLGAIDRYVLKFGPEKARKLIEGMATKATEYFTGKKQTSYLEEQKLAEKLIGKHGFKKAMEGRLPIFPSIEYTMSGTSSRPMKLLIEFYRN